MASLDLPYRCPRCGEHKRFRSLSSLRAHLEYNHTYETLYVLSKSNSVCDAAALLPLVAEGALAAESRFPCSGDELGLATTSSAGARYIPNVEFPLGEILVKKAMSSMDPSAMEAAYEEGLARLRARAFERLELDERLEKLSEEVEQKIAARVGRLQTELERKSSELEKAKLESERLSQEKQELEDKASELSRQVDVSVEMLASLKQDLVNKEQELTHKQQEVAQIDQFLQETAAREASAKVRLQQFIEELLERADRAEKQLQIISSCGTTPNGSLGHCSLQGSKSNGRQKFPKGDLLHDWQPGVLLSFCLESLASGRSKSVSQASVAGYDSDSVELQTLEGSLEAQYYHGQGRPREPSPYERCNWGLRKQAIQNWQRRPYRNSTEGEEGDISDVASRTTESEAEMWEQERRAECQQHCSHRSSYRLGTGRSEGCYKPCRHEKSPSKSSEVVSPEVLKMRAALFCIFTYLDTKTLLRTAEVCRDWRFVARHPAVWTRVLLENARISSKFLCTLSQWCTQTHSLIMQNLKPRQRGKKETKEEYLKSTRGCLEEGLEALLKATGGNLLILKVSHCPNLLTDRSLWLASCYCRALQAVTYRGSGGDLGFGSRLQGYYFPPGGAITSLIGIEDYFEDPSSPEARKLFDEMVNKLQALKKRPGFSKILHVKADGLC
ncbi:F-box only protein 41 [Bagarius yarrelli]|uniref:F-box only protein 41 n=1 Tax=Bagarius yarrelli TaxID=175774 RepID=A0A556V485_BAGYA|nr:F-box only protein 41 [Bagarius yarrelli]